MQPRVAGLGLGRRHLLGRVLRLRPARSSGRVWGNPHPPLPGERLRRGGPAGGSAPPLPPRAPPGARSPGLGPRAGEAGAGPTWAAERRGRAGLQVVLPSWEGCGLPGSPDRRMRGVPGKRVHLLNSECAKRTNREAEAAAARLGDPARSEYNSRFRFSLNPKGKHFMRLQAV